LICERHGQMGQCSTYDNLTWKDTKEQDKSVKKQVPIFESGCSRILSRNDAITTTDISVTWIKTCCLSNIPNRQSQSYFTTVSLPPISSSWPTAPWDSRPDFLFSIEHLHSPNVTFSLTRGWVCRLQLLLALARAIILRSESRRTHNHTLLSQIRDPPNLEGQVPVFISPRNRAAHLFPRHWVSIMLFRIMWVLMLLSYAVDWQEATRVYRASVSTREAIRDENCRTCSSSRRSSRGLCVSFSRQSNRQSTEKWSDTIHAQWRSLSVPL
jgi:hypothetical protein